MIYQPIVQQQNNTLQRQIPHNQSQKKKKEVKQETPKQSVGTSTNDSSKNKSATNPKENSGVEKTKEEVKNYNPGNSRKLFPTEKEATDEAENGSTTINIKQLNEKYLDQEIVLTAAPHVNTEFEVIEHIRRHRHLPVR